MSIGRNEPCPCGSGLKYKKCCINKQGKRPVYYTLLLIFGGMILLVSFVLVVQSIRNFEQSSGSKQVWSEEHQHYHQAP